MAFISGISRLNDPWGDLVNYFRDVTVTQVKYRLLANAVNELAREPFELAKIAAHPGLRKQNRAGPSRITGRKTGGQRAGFSDTE